MTVTTSTAPLARSAEELEELLQLSNEQGNDALALIVDSRSHPWLVFGEETTGGGEYMAVWLTDGDAIGDNLRGEATCDHCGRVVEPKVPLSGALYPVQVLWRS